MPGSISDPATEHNQHGRRFDIATSSAEIQQKLHGCGILESGGNFPYIVKRNVGGDIEAARVIADLEDGFGKGLFSAV
jgi:hypothetical protein|tara:strand:- start:17622 stop:17855 length:234 start_codon:yes stop_codon:yes gene_type:complete